MRSLIILLIAIVAFQYSNAQTDSTQIKLQQYKQWHEQGIITDEEYIDVKAKLLAIQPTKKATVNKDELQAMHDKAKSEITGGACFLGFGIAFGAGAFIHDNIAPFPSTSDRDYQSKISQRKTTTVILAVAGVASGVGGAIILAIGLNHMHLYKDKKQELAFDVGCNAMGLVYNF